MKLDSKRWWMDTENMQIIDISTPPNLVFACPQANHQEQAGGEVWKRGLRAKALDKPDEINVQVESSKLQDLILLKNVSHASLSINPTHMLDLHMFSNLPIPLTFISSGTWIKQCIIKELIWLR